MKLQAAAFAWYPSAAEYEKMLSICEDKAKLPDTFTEWQELAKYGFNQVSARPGLTVVKIDVYAAEFLAWCRAENRKIDGAGRADFANHKLNLQIQSGEIKM